MTTSKGKKKTNSRRKNKPVIQEKKEERSLSVGSVTWGELTWLNIEQPGEQEIEYLAQNYPFHPLDLDDCLSRIQRPKIDEYPDYLFLVFHFPVFNVEARVTTPSQVSVFIGNSYLITLHKGDLKPLVKLLCPPNEGARLLKKDQACQPRRARLFRNWRIVSQSPHILPCR